MADSSTPNPKSSDLLPRFFRTDSNKKFLKATIDQLIQPGTVNKVNGYIGRQNAKATTGQDIFISEVSNDRQNYQLEPGLTVNDALGNTTFFKDYQDYINQIKVFGGDVSNHARLNEQEFYSWNPHINWDKFTNFQNYYWLPYGPDLIHVSGARSTNNSSTYTVRVESQIDNNAYVFIPNGLDRNPSITLYRGTTYKFEINSPGNPFSIKTAKSAGVQDRYETIGLDNYAVTNGTITFTVPTNSPDVLYYVSEKDIELGGVFNILSITENSFIDVGTDILGKKTFTLSDGTPLSNGMRISFNGKVTPSKYETGVYYVEGVGSSIRLINELDLKTISFTTQTETVLFDDLPFDQQPFEDASLFEAGVDYIVVNRASGDLNPWSRINRWTHKDVIELSAKYNGKSVDVDQALRAVRPIIEFEPDLKLFNFGTTAIADIDLVDTYTTDVFSTIEGTLGYNIDTVKVSEGQRILFTADTDLLVRNKIFKVQMLYLDGERRIHLELDTTPIENNVALVLQGSKNKGSMFWFDGNTWTKTQQKTSLNQPPLFDIVDSTGVSYSNLDSYPGSTFTGTKLFSYKVGTSGTNDILGFPLSYKNISNIGDIVFNFDLATDQFSYKENNLITNNAINVGFLVKTINSETTYVNGWELCETKLYQPALRIYKNENVVLTSNIVKGDTYTILNPGSTDFSKLGASSSVAGTKFVATRSGEDTGTVLRNTFDLDIFDDITNLNDLIIRVYINGIRLDQVDATDLTNPNWVVTDSPQYKKITLKNSISSSDVVTIKAVSLQPINTNGYYEIPINLQNNPLNGIIGDFTLGEVIDHVNSIVDNLDSFVGIFPGTSNLRDLGNVSKFGTRFVQHSGPLSLSLYHLTSDTHNIIKAIEYSKNEYNKFKKTFVTIAESLNLDNLSLIDRVEKILQTINENKSNDAPFYFSDMIPYGSNIKTDHTVIDRRIKNYPLNTPFSLTTLSTRAVIVYLNGDQLLHEHDYEFNDQGFVVILADIKNNDTITICEYDSTNGCFVPPTPTKLGLWPSYDPKIFEDSSLITPRKMIQGHDGSLVLCYNDYRDDLILEIEKRIYNNIKIGYDPEIFDIYSIIPGYNRKTGYSLSEFNTVLSSNFYKWLENVDVDFTNAASTYDRLNPLTFNYNNHTLPDGTSCLGYWKGIYRWVLDTDRPNITPWEMLGFFDKPTWWEAVYGPAPYTSDNLILWQDLSKGQIKEPGKPVITKEQFVRPELINYIPVTQEGKIESPQNSGWATGVIDYSSPGDFVFGDVSPVESAWRRSSFYSFSVIIAALLLKPAKTFGVLLDRSRIVKNLAGHLIYKDTGLAITPSSVKLPSRYSSTTDVQTSGIINYISDYILSDKLKSYSKYTYELSNLEAVLSYRIGSFTSKEKFNLLLDSKTPLSTGSVFVPQEDYKIILNSSSPIKKVTYSGVIISKLSTGFEIKGYSKTQPFFKYYPSKKTGISINVGGISESYLIWEPSNLYSVGKVVSYNNRYYRVNTTHTSEDTFNSQYFNVLQSLPIQGGQDAVLRVEWDRTEELVLPYGTTLSTIQDVVDFLLGYGEFLKDEGFVFDEYNSDLAAITNWETSVKEFLFWTTQNWSTGEDKWLDWLPYNVVYFNSIVKYNGDYWKAKRNIAPSAIFEEQFYEKLSSLSTVGSSVISLSPAAERITINTEYSVVDDIRNSFNDYEIFTASGTPIQPSFINLFREDNSMSYSSQLEEGIYGASFYLIQKEQVVLLKNSTIFNDTIYNPFSGYRQERIKVAGYVASNWNGSFNIPGFIFDQANINEWETWTDYALGDIVKYKEFYYSAKSFLPGTETFDNNHWIKLDSKPTSQLLPNWSYKASQFTDFYSLDSDNFDISQQEVAQHYVGYQKRQYLENIIQDSVSEYKFYQGMIAEKGTQNVLSKLFDVLSADNMESLSFYEEWALRVGNFGATGAFENIEFILDEEKFKTNPQGFELQNSEHLFDLNSSLIIKQTPGDVYLKPFGYNSNPWPVISNYKPYLRTPGYVREDEVKTILGSIDEIFSLTTVGYSDGDYIWCGFEGKGWNIYRFSQSNIKIESIDATDSIIFYTTSTHNLEDGDIIGFSGVLSISSFFRVVVINPTSFGLTTSLLVTPDELEIGKILVSKLVQSRISNIDDLNTLHTTNVKDGELVWCDDIGTGKWATLQYNPVYVKTSIFNSQPVANQQFGKTLVTNAIGTVAVISTNLGEIVVFDKYALGSAWIRRQTIQRAEISKFNAFDLDATPASVTAQVAAISDDGVWLATGTPLATKATSFFTGNYNVSNTYTPKSVVVYNDLYYQAKTLVNLTLSRAITAAQGAYVTQPGSHAAGYVATAVTSSTTVTIILTSILTFDTTHDITVNFDTTPSTTNLTVKPTIVTTLTSSSLYTQTAPSTSRFWKKIYYISHDIDGNNSSLTNQGVISLYKKDPNNIFTLVDTILSPVPTSNEKFGTSIVFGNNTMFVSATGNNSNVGKVYKFSYSKISRATATYNYVGSSGKTLKVSSTFGIEAGMTVSGIGITSNQYVVQIIDSTTLTISDLPDLEPSGVLTFSNYGWSVDRNLDNTLFSLTHGNVAQGKFGSSMSITNDNSTLVVTAPNSSVGHVYVYRLTNVSYALTQTLAGESDVSFGANIAVSDTGAYLAISSTLYDTSLSILDSGRVSIYQNIAGTFTLNLSSGIGQTISIPVPEINQEFGSKIAFMNDFDTLVVYSLNGDTVTPLTFDSGTTIFDSKLTEIVTTNADSGRVDIYDRYNTKWLFSESLYVESDDVISTGYGTSIAVAKNKILVSAPLAYDGTIRAGKVYDYSKTEKSLSWTALHQESDKIDAKKIKQAFLYDRTTNKLITYLDVLDAANGKIPGVADQEIKFKTFYDPAIYTEGNSSVVVDEGMSWGESQVGVLWWNLDTARFIDSYDDSSVYKNTVWNKLHPKASIDIYEWVETSLLPSAWNELADTEEGVALGISGTTLYDDTVYSSVRQYDKISRSFSETYYYWVKNKKTVPAVFGRNLSAYDVSQFIGNPRGQGYRYLALTGTNSFSLVNVHDNTTLNEKNTVLSIEYWTIDNPSATVHSEWKIVNESDRTVIPTKIENKWVDSLCGTDINNNPVPNMNLPVKLRYGIESRPLQGMFVNRFEALKQVVEQTNRILIDLQVVTQYDISKLDTYDVEPSIITGTYDEAIDTYNELRFTAFGIFKKPTLVPVIKDGKIVSVTIEEKGSGYGRLQPKGDSTTQWYGPFIDVIGEGAGAVLRSILNVKGQIVDVEIVSPGEGYSSLYTSLSVRNFSVLVRSDSQSFDVWSIYSYEPSTEIWSKIISQTYDTRQFWEYVDWFAVGYNQFTAPDYLINTFAELNTIDTSIGDIIKVQYANTGNWMLLFKFSNSISVDWTQTYKVVGIQNGTIQFKQSLYQVSGTQYGYDATLYDTGIFDNYASKELRIILDTLKNDIFIETLRGEYVKLFFTSVRYLLSEQNYVDWIFKTSFVKAQHNVGDLKQKVTYNNDNLKDFEEYVSEVKPYRTKVREYVSSYTQMDMASSAVSDFDLPVIYEDDTFRSIATTVTNGQLDASSSFVTQYPWKFWLDNVGFSITEIRVVDGGSGYVSAPLVKFESTSGSGAVARAFVASGKVNRIILLNPGSGYLSTPKIVLDGGLLATGVAGKAVAVIGNSVIRTNLIKMKFDRISDQYLITNLTEVEVFYGNKVKVQFSLRWAPNIRVGLSTVTIDNNLVLRDDYKLLITKSKSSGYTQYAGSIIFDTPPAKGAVIKVTYLKDWSMLNSSDRILHYYNPSDTGLGKDLSLLMTGIDYGGVVVTGLGFESGQGWDSKPFFSEKWDTIDPTQDDYIEKVGESKHQFILNYIPDEGTLINVYRSRDDVTTIQSDGLTTIYNYNSLTSITSPTIKIVTDNVDISGVVAHGVTPTFTPALALDKKMYMISTVGIVPGMTVVGNAFTSGQYVAEVNNLTTVTLNTPPNIIPASTVYFTLNKAGSDILKVSSTDALKVGDLVEISPFVINTLGFETKILAIIDSTTLQLDQILFKTVEEPTSVCTFTRELFDPNDCIVNRDGTIVLPEPINTASSIVIRTQSEPVRLDDIYFGTVDQTNPNAEMTTIVAGAPTEDEIRNNYFHIVIPQPVSIEAEDTIIIRKSTSDGSFAPQAQDYDTALSGGDWGYNTARGLAADEVLIDGDGLVTPTSSPAPEEVVPGQIVDSLSVKVFDSPISGSAQIKVDQYISDGTTVNYQITQGINSAEAVIVKVETGYINPVTSEASSISTVLTQDVDYTVDFVTRIITLTTPADENSIISIFSFGFNGSNILDLNSIVASGITEYPTLANWQFLTNSLIYVDGVPVTSGVELYRFDETATFAGHVGIRFINPPAVGSIINYVIVGGAEQPFSIMKSETFDSVPSTFSQQIVSLTPNETLDNYTIKIDNGQYVRRGQEVTGTNIPADTYVSYDYTDGTNFVRLSNAKLGAVTGTIEFVNNYYNLQNKVGNSLPNETNMIVRVDQRIFEAPNTSYFTIDRMNFGITVLKAMPYTISSSNVSVFANGVKLNVGLNYEIDVSGITIKLKRSTYNQYKGKELVVSIQSPTGYQYFASTSTLPDRITLPVTDAGHKIEVISFYKHDILDIQRTSFTMNSTVDVNPDVVQSYNYNDLLSKIVVLGRKVINDHYVWVIKNSKLLSPSIDFKLDPSRDSITLARKLKKGDILTLLTFSGNILSTNIAYMQFKDMLNRTHFKRLSLEKQTRLAQPLRFYDSTIILDDASAFSLPNPAANKPGIIEIEGERIEYFTIVGNTLGQLRRGTLGTGIRNIYKQGAYVQDIGLSETVPYQESTIIRQIKSTGSKIINLDFIPKKVDDVWTYSSGFTSSIPPYYGQANDIEVFVGGYDTSNSWSSNVTYTIGDIVTVGSYAYRCISNHTSSLAFETDYDPKNITNSTKWEFFIGNIRLKKTPYMVHNINKNPNSPAGDVQFDADFAVDGVSASIRLTNELPAGTFITVIKKQGTDWDSISNVREGDNEIAKYIRNVDGIRYHSITKYEQHVGLNNTFDQKNVSFDSDYTTFDQG